MNPAKPSQLSTKTRKFSPRYRRVQVGGGYWVNGFTVNEILGWNSQRLRRARENGEIDYKYDERGELLYDIKSVPPEVIEILKRKTA